MLVGIHVDQYGGFCKFLQRYETILNANGINHRRVDVNDKDFWSIVQSLDLFIFRWRHSDWYRQLAQSVLPVIEQRTGVACFPNQVTCWHYDDKIRQYYLLSSSGFPMVDTWIFWDELKALEWAQSTKYPVVFKLKGGAGSQNVLLVSDRQKASKLIRQMFAKGIFSNRIRDLKATRLVDFDLRKGIRHFGRLFLDKLDGHKWGSNWQLERGYVMFQKFLPGNRFDTRVTVIGNRAFAYRRWNRDSDFRASGSGKIDTSPEQIDRRCIEIAHMVSRELGFQSMAYDFLFDESGAPFFCEISYTYVDSLVWSCPGYWDRDLVWHPGHFWPQYCQLVDLTGIPDMVQPDM